MAQAPPLPRTGEGAGGGGFQYGAFVMSVALDRNAERNATEGITLLQAVSEALQEEMARDPRVVLLGQDIGRKGGVFKATVGLQAEFGALRVLDTPIAEDVIAGTAIGAAMMGLRPIAEFQFADYIFPALDQIVSQAATIRWRSVGGFGVPAVFRAPFGAGVRGGVYHSQSVEAYFCHAPGLKVVDGNPARCEGPPEERHPR